MSGQALARHDVAPVIHPHRVKHVLCDIDPEDVHLWFPGTRLLWLNGFTDLNSLWLIAVDPHRGGSISLRPSAPDWPASRYPLRRSHCPYGAHHTPVAQSSP